jgi:hypothetical protein
MKPIAYTLIIARPRRRARELYAADTPFRGRVERDRTRYNRKIKHRNQEDQCS